MVFTNYLDKEQISMGNPLAGLKKSNDVNEAKDQLGGGGVLESKVYPVTILAAFIGYSKNKAMSLTIHAKTVDGFEIRNSQWMTSGEAKGCLNYYEKNGEKHYLPGFNIANAICELTVGKEISEMETEEKVVKLYDFDLKKEMDTAVPMLVELVGQQVALGILKQVVDKNVDDGTGKYVPSGETREQNEVSAVFDVENGLTLLETRAKEEEPIFLEKWNKKWEGKVDMRAKGAAEGGVSKGKLGGEKKKASSSLFANKK